MTSSRAARRLHPSARSQGPPGRGERCAASLPAAFAVLVLVLGLGLACAGLPGGGPRVAEPSSGAEEAPRPGLEPGLGRPQVVLLVTVAGMTPEAYLGPDASMPTLAALARVGIAAEAVRPVSPAAVYPAHATLVTGVPPRVHGVTADRLLGERGVRSARFSHASHLRADPLWQVVRAAGGGVAALDWPGTAGASIPLLLPDLAGLAAGERWAEAVAREATPWMGELVRHAGEATDASGPARDEVLVDAACTVLRSPEVPRLVLLRLSQTERPLRAAGPFASAARAAFAGADAALGRLITCAAEAGVAERTALVVAGDRALVPVHSVVRPNRVLRDLRLLASGGPGREVAWRALARSNGGSAFVYARDAEAALAARDALAATAAETGAFRVVSAEEMIGRDADPEAWFGLEAEPGFVLRDGSQGPLVGPAPVRGAGGGLRDEGPGLVAVGRGLRGGLRVPSMRQEDVAPTLAELLGVALPEARGRAFVGWLAPGLASGAGEGP